MDIKPNDIALSAASASVSAKENADIADDPVRDAALRKKAAEFEAVFIGQFLKHSGLEKAFGQEAGHYGQFLLNEISEQLAMSGGFGVAEDVYKQLKEQDAAARAEAIEAGADSETKRKGTK